MSDHKIYGVFAVMARMPLELTYAIPFEGLTPGCLCVVKVKAEHFVALFIDFCPPPSFACIPVERRLEFVPALSSKLLSLAQYVSSYYCSTFPLAAKSLVPGFLCKKSRWALTQKNWNKPYRPAKIEIKSPAILNDAQKEVAAKLESLRTQGFHVSLLQGATGSGKTEIYLHLVLNTLREGKNAIVLVPEIALTPQMELRFRAILGNDLALLHSALAGNNYEREWLRAAHGQARVVLGVRTSVFCPLSQVGLIIVDEEHDASYKAQEVPSYHARDMAVVRAQKEGALCILGSATPSLETFYNAIQGKFHHITLSARYASSNVESQVVSLGAPSHILRTSQLAAGRPVFAPAVWEALKEQHRKKEQTLILVNRRGFYHFALCAACASPLSCPHCAVSTTLHHNGTTEICHYCQFRRPARKVCPLCGGSEFLFRGFGTQQVEEELAKELPELKIGRFDRDMMTSHTRISQILSDFSQGALDCLVGTQMLAKGHDFPKVTLVVIVHVEDGLFLPDFRSGERTFQLLMQALGRAGRGEHAGRVLFQTLLGSHPLLEFVFARDFNGFAQRELNLRRLAGHPPFMRQILLEIGDKNLDKLGSMACQLRDTLLDSWKEKKFSPKEVRLAGPYPATLEKLQDVFRHQICISFAKSFKPQQILPLEKLKACKALYKNIRIDVDPLSFL